MACFELGLCCIADAAALCCDAAAEAAAEAADAADAADDESECW